MPKFAYSAIDATGAEIEGTTKADTLGTARSILVEKNLFPIRIEESKGMFDFELTKEKAKKNKKGAKKNKAPKGEKIDDATELKISEVPEKISR